MKITEDNYWLIERAQDILSIDYKSEIKWFDAENIEGYIDNDCLLDIIENLFTLLDYREEQLEDYKSRQIVDKADYYEEELIRKAENNE